MEESSFATNVRGVLYCTEKKEEKTEEHKTKGTSPEDGYTEGLDAETYVVILQNELQWTIDFHFKEAKGVVFQQDGDGTHRAKVVQQHFKKQKWTTWSSMYFTWSSGSLSGSCYNTQDAGWTRSLPRRRKRRRRS